MAFALDIGEGFAFLGDGDGGQRRFSLADGGRGVAGGMRLGIRWMIGGEVDFPGVSR